MDEVISFIREIIPDITEGQETTLKNTLDEIGVISIKDLQHLDADTDLSKIFKVIQTRKLNAAIKLANQPIHVPQVQILQSSPSTPVSNFDNSLLSPSFFNNSQLQILNYTLDEDKVIPKSLMKKIKKKELPSGSERHDMVRNIINDVWGISRYPGRKIFAGIARQLSGKYPHTFADRYEDGTLIGMGYLSLERKLIERMANKNREYKKSKCLESDAEDENQPEKKKKRSCKKDRYGCTNFDPILPQEETLETQQNKKEWMIQESKMSSAERHDVMIDDFMAVTFASQRSTINDQTPIATLLTEWPLLFEKRYFLRHFSQLMNFELFEKADSSIILVVPLLVNYLRSKVEASAATSISSESSNKKPELVSMKNLRNDLIQIRSLEDVKDQFICTLLAVMRMWGQPIDELFVTRTTTSSIAEIESNVDGHSPSHPHVVVLADTLSVEGVEACCVVENTVLEAPMDVYSATMMCFGAYFVFMMKYPLNLAPTMEFIQRLIMKIEDDGTKVERIPNKNPPPKIQPKVLTLQKSLQAYKAAWKM